MSACECVDRNVDGRSVFAGLEGTITKSLNVSHCT